MKIPINITFVVLAFVSVCMGIIFSKRKKLLISFVLIGLFLIAAPFARFRILTSDAYDWTIVVERKIDASKGPKVIYIDQIEWITDYEKLKRQRGHTRSYLLNDKSTGKVWNVKGYIPLSIKAKIGYGQSQHTVSKVFRGLEAGSYTFTLTFDENGIGSWALEPKVDARG